MYIDRDALIKYPRQLIVDKDYDEAWSTGIFYQKQVLLAIVDKFLKLGYGEHLIMNWLLKLTPSHGTLQITKEQS
jgi:hypothetical protein